MTATVTVDELAAKVQAEALAKAIQALPQHIDLTDCPVQDVRPVIYSLITPAEMDSFHWFSGCTGFGKLVPNPNGNGQVLTFSVEAGGNEGYKFRCTGHRVMPDGSFQQFDLFLAKVWDKKAAAQIAARMIEHTADLFIW
jgi:hypothetical protein